MKVLVPIFTLTWRVNNYVFRQGKSICRRNESKVKQKFFFIALTIAPSTVTSFIKKTVKQQFDSSSVKTIDYSSLAITFPVENGNSIKQEEIGSVNQGKLRGKS